MMAHKTPERKERESGVSAKFSELIDRIPHSFRDDLEFLDSIADDDIRDEIIRLPYEDPTGSRREWEI